METNIPLVSRQDILNFPFPYKLWLVVNLEFCDFLHWNRDGTVILLDLVALVQYLNSTLSIFIIKNSSCFLKHLEDFQFERLNLTPETDEDVLLQYKNENFQRHRLDLLPKIRRHTYQLLDQFPTQHCENNNDERLQITKLISERMLGDLCFMFHGSLSNIKKSRLHFQTVLHFNKEQRILKQKLEASESAVSCKSKLETPLRSGAGTSLISEEDQAIELPVELFENPHDSVLNLGEDFLPEYAGYYGNCSTDQILNFFGEYLPKYEDGSMEVKKILPDNSAESSNNIFPANTETYTMQFHSLDSTGNPRAIISTPIIPNAMNNLNFSSNLEPIFITNEIANETDLNSNTNNTNNDFTVTYLNSNMLSTDDDFYKTSNFIAEDDIAMEEFLQFKNVKSENLSVDYEFIKKEEKDDGQDFNSCSQDQENTTMFPQMPTSFQMKLNEDVQENEANFRNFFSQYRASLNLLYERQ